MMKKLILPRNITNSRQECKKHALIMSKMAKITYKTRFPIFDKNVYSYEGEKSEGNMGKGGGNETGAGKKNNYE